MQFRHYAQHKSKFAALVFSATIWLNTDSKNQKNNKGINVMTQCSFCGTKENKVTPVCQSCGALRYPIAKNTRRFSRQDKLKISATIAAVAVTPGSFFVLALYGANRLNSKIKKS